MDKHIYLTTTLPYVNAEPHIGFALETVQADVFARYHALQENKVFFNIGTDEHGLKIYRKAKELGRDPQEYVDEYAAKFSDLKEALNLSYNNFIRTTDPHHIAAAQEFWKRCEKNGDIYKKSYSVKYCVGCELEKTDSELEDGKCPLHPTSELEKIEEENYFFRFSNYQEKLLSLYRDNPNFVIPDYRQKEIENFVSGGLQDFSISRLKEKMPWGIEVPNDPKHVMYVWFDALINYISAIGWPDEEKFNAWWPVVQFAGKDNLRQQSAIWQAMLLSAGLTPSKQIIIHGFLTVDGQKISKSLGNVINPLELVAKYGTDAVRYFLLAKVNPFEDSDFTYEKFEEAYNADLANGLGNLVARVLTMIEKFSDGKVPEIGKDPDSHPLRVDETIFNWKKSWRAIDDNIPTYQFHEAIGGIWKFISEADKYINATKPWKLAKDNSEELNWVLYGLADALHQVAWQLYPFLPETSVEIAGKLNIQKLLVGNPSSKGSWTNIKPGTKVLAGNPLFPRIQ